MSITLLKDSDDTAYLENVSNQILQAPDELGAAAGTYIIEEDGLPVFDTATNQPQTIEITV